MAQLRTRLIISGFVGIASASAAVYVLQQRNRHVCGPLSPSAFTPAMIIKTDDHGPASKIITVQLPPRTSVVNTASIWSVFLKHDDIQVERPYTPLEDVDEKNQVRFWIKRYPTGEVSRWVHKKQVGDHVEIRGPLQTWLWQADTWDHVVMVWIPRLHARKALTAI